MSPFGTVDPVDVYHGWVIMAALFSAIGTWVLSVVLLRIYRRRVHIGMLSRSGPEHMPPVLQAQREVPLRPAMPIPLRSAVTAESRLLLGRYARRARSAQLVFGVAGLGYGLAATVIEFTLEDIPFAPVRTAVTTLMYGWLVVPTVLAQSTLARRVSISAWSAYFAVLLVLMGVARLPLGQMLLLLGLVVLPQALLIIATSARAVRGAAWLVAPALFLAAMAALQLSVPFTYIRFGVPPDGTAWLFVLAAFGCLALLAAYGLGLLRAYRSKLASDQNLLVLQWWFVAAMWLVSDLAKFGVYAVFGLVPFGLIVLFLLATSSLRRPAAGRPVRLLMLRTFGSRQRSTQLLRELTGRWRWIGSVELVIAPDIATEVLEPDGFIDFLRGRLDRRFVKDEEGLHRRLANVDLAPDRDGRYRINELLCQGHAWQQSVEALVPEVDAVVIDLRGFGINNLGVTYELGRLVALSPLQRVVAVVDPSTDTAALESVLRKAAEEAPATAPIWNGGANYLPTVTVGQKPGGNSTQELWLAVATAASPRVAIGVI